MSTHNMRASSAERVRAARANLIASAKDLRDFECARAPDACKVVETLSQQLLGSGTIDAV